MKDYQKEVLLYKILSGKTIIEINSTRLDVVTPSLDLLYESNLLFQKYYEKPGIKTRDEIRTNLVSLGIIKREDIDFLDKSNSIIQNLQKELFINFSSINADSIRELIRQTREKIYKILMVLSKYETYSLEGAANYVKSVFIIKNTTFYKDCLFDFHKINYSAVLSEIQKFNCSSDEIREIAKCHTWSNIWFGLKGSNIFLNGSNISLDQQLLLVWSRLYDNIKENPESPSDEITNDNDALDGWLLLQREENLKKTKENASKKKYSSKLDKCDEVFVLVNNKEEADRVLSMNNAYSKRVMNQRLNEVSKRGEVNYHNFEDVRQDLQMTYNKMVTENFRGKKN